jgi:hypothetical protein
MIGKKKAAFRLMIAAPAVIDSGLHGNDHKW